MKKNPFYLSIIIYFAIIIPIAVFTDLLDLFWTRWDIAVSRWDIVVFLGIVLGYWIPWLIYFVSKKLKHDKVIADTKLKHDKVIADTNWFLSELSSYIAQELKKENTLLYDAQGRKIKQDIVFESKIRRDLATKLSLAALSVVNSKKVDLNDKLAIREHTLKDFDKKEKERAKNEYSHQKNLTYKLDITSFKITLNYKTSRGEITGSIPLGKIFLSLLGYKVFIELFQEAVLTNLLHNNEDIPDFDVREDSFYDNASNDEMDFDHDNVSSDTADIDYTVYRKFEGDSDGDGDGDGDGDSGGD